MTTVDSVSSVERDRIRTWLDSRLAFNSVTARVFPLKASMNRLQDFCDNYLNFVDDEKSNRPSHYFKPAMPWVFCQVLNYGEMTNATRTRGWISQHEVLFMVPLAWYVIEKGELRFKDWAMVSPFIYVDNDLSVTAGREIYGWIKVRAWLDRLDQNWADDPRKPRCLIDVSTELFPRAYAGEALEPRTLLQITQAPAPDVFRDPFSKDAIYGPGWTFAEAARTSVGFVRTWLEAAAAFPLQGYGPRSVPSTVEMFAKSAFNLTRLLPWWQPDRDTVREALMRAHARGRNYYMNQINLKQFRDAEEPTFACYQALVNSRITIDHYYNGGLLGAANVAFGDITGGIRLLLHDYPEQQIQDTLGLEVEEWQQAPDNHRLAVLVPQFPFWASYDLHYDNGDTLCWRTKTSEWHCDPCQEELCKDGRANAFNTADGLAIQEQYGPNVYPDVTVRVFPLEACKETLQRYCDENINKQGDPPPPDALPKIGDHYFKPWGSYVYMCLITHSNTESIPFSHGNNIGPTARPEVVFYLPVKWYRRKTSDPQSKYTPTLEDDIEDFHLYKLGVLTPFVFGQGRQVISEREVNGLPSTYGELAGGPDVWLNTFRGKERSVLAELTTLLVTALEVGQPAREETLVEVVSVPREVLNEIESGSTTFGDILLAVLQWLVCWLRRIEYWIERIFLSALPWSLTFLRPRFLDYIAALPFNRVSLKRIFMTGRKAGKKATHEFAYQALVLAEQTIDRLFASNWVDKKRWGMQRFVDRLDDDIRVDIRYYEALDIAGTLGLKDGKDIAGPGAPVQEFRPHDPFAIRMHVTEGIGYNTATRIDAEPWSEDLLVVPKKESERPFQFPQTSQARNDLITFAGRDGPQKMIRRYVRKYGKGGSCWKLPID